MPSSTITKIQNLYLNPNGADVWFLIDGQRIPGHKFILSASNQYYSTMFYGSMPERNNEVNMSESNVRAEEFEEFLKFLYGLEPNLSLDNIGGVLNLAKQAFADDVLVACEEFLRQSMTTDTIFFAYQLAQVYDLDRLKEICKEEYCVQAENILKSSSFQNLTYEHFREILFWDSLACEEIDIFDACIEWAKGTCKRKGLDESIAKNLRDQLRDSIFQIRFTSMTKEEVGRCIQLHPELFTADEMVEIICMIGGRNSFKLKRFNWTPRNFNIEWYKGRRLEFSRANHYMRSDAIKQYLENRTQVTRFVCNRRTILKEILCEIGRETETPIHVTLRESKNETDWIECYDEQLMINFNESVPGRQYFMFQGKISLSKAILLRPKCTYDLIIEFENLNSIAYIRRNCHLSMKTRVDHDTVFNFDNNGIVVGLTVYRVDNKNFFQKIVHNPKTWMILGSAVVISTLLYQAKIYIDMPVLTKVIANIDVTVAADMYDVEFNFWLWWLRHLTIPLWQRLSTYSM